MPATSPTLTRAWFDRTTIAVRDARDTLQDKGLTVSGPIEWVDADDVRLVVTFHGASVTIATPDESSAVLREWVLPVGWVDQA